MHVFFKAQKRWSAILTVYIFFYPGQRHVNCRNCWRTIIYQVIDTVDTRQFIYPRRAGLYISKYCSHIGYFCIQVSGEDNYIKRRKTLLKTWSRRKCFSSEVQSWWGILSHVNISFRNWELYFLFAFIRVCVCVCRGKE